MNDPVVDTVFLLRLRVQHLERALWAIEDLVPDSDVAVTDGRRVRRLARQALAGTRVAERLEVPTKDELAKRFAQLEQDAVGDFSDHVSRRE